jgi:hypothetical protein
MLRNCGCFDWIKTSNAFRLWKSSSYTLQVCHKTKSNAIPIIRASALVCIVCRCSEYECICHPLVFRSGRSTKLVPMLDKMSVALPYVTEWHGHAVYHR